MHFYKESFYINSLISLNNHSETQLMYFTSISMHEWWDYIQNSLLREYKSHDWLFWFVLFIFEKWNEFTGIILFDRYTRVKQAYWCFQICSEQDKYWIDFKKHEMTRTLQQLEEPEKETQPNNKVTAITLRIFTAKWTNRGNV